MMPALGRRKFLSFLGAAPVAAKLAAEELAGITSFGNHAANGSALAGLVRSDAIAAPSASPDLFYTLALDKKKNLFKLALQNPTIRAELEGLAYEEARHVAHIDHDLASKRSFSLAAKITFQRQRDVERHMRYACADQPWQKIENWSRTIFKRFLPLV